MNFLDNLNDLLRMNKMTRSEMARQIGIAPSTINAWYTKGCDGVALKTLIRISQLFDITIEDLVNGNGKSLYFSDNIYSDSELDAIRRFTGYIKAQRQE